MTVTADRHAAGPPFASRPVNTVHTGTWAASVGLATRNLRNIRRLPSTFLPAVLMPIFQAIAFSGTFFAITQVPGFPTDRSINWFMPLAVVLGSGFAGIGIGLSTVRDIETGFYDRIRMTPAPRRSLVAGLLLSALARSVVVTSAVVVVGTLFGARLAGNVGGLVPLYVAGLGVATIGTGWALGLAYRFRDMRGAAIMQLTLFLVLFLTEAQAPIAVIDGWLETVARYNPFTYILRLARSGYLDDTPTSDIVAGLVAIAVLASLTLWFARRGLERLED
jgi:ABC-2 type transport system permease protein